MSSLYEAAVAHPGGHRDVRPDQVALHLRDVRVIDVRDPHEFNGEYGHIAGAELVPLATLGEATQRWTKDAELVVVCRSGRRSEQAAATLTAAGFPRVMNMVGGMLAWNQARLPIDSANSAA